MKHNILTKSTSAILMILTIVITSFPAISRAQNATGIATGAGASIAACALGSLLTNLNLGSTLGKLGIGGGSTGTAGITGGGNAVPVKVTDSVQSDMQVVRQSADWQKQKECHLDALAWTLASEILQGMTESVVDWINNGFEGDPAFIQNPQMYFMNQADQVTGSFLSNAGPLAGLCDGFNLDIRLSIANNSVGKSKDTYKCTLSTIINKAKNASINVSVNQNSNGATLNSIANGGILSNSNQLSVNGNSVTTVGNAVSNGFNDGGGWGGLLAISTIPENNPMWTYLMAREDLKQQIAKAKEQTNNDLNRGGGFLSYTHCDDKKNPATCKVYTPGSVISSTLNNTLNIPANKLINADEINEVINALFNQLVKKALQSGLSTLSITPSGMTQSTIQQLSAQSTAQTEATKSASMAQISAAVNNYLQPMTDFKYYRDKSLEAIQFEFDNVNALLASCQASGNSQDTSDNLQTLLDSQIIPALNQAQIDADNAQTGLSMIQNIQQYVNATDVQNASNQYSNFLGSSYIITADNVKEANSTYTLATTAAEKWNTKAAQYEAACGLTP